MLLDELERKIKKHEAKLAVIGLGYVGLPVAAMFADAGYDVLGVELKEERVEKINQGKSPIEGEEPGLEEMISRVVFSKRLRATTKYQELTDRDVILIDVETPVDHENIPRYEALKSALLNLRPVIKSGTLIIVESTIAPGTMQQFVQPILEEDGKIRLNRDYYLGNCPERVMPGKLLANLKSLSRVVGGGSPETAKVMVSLYENVVEADLDAVDWVTAELVKTTENAYRDVQIAFANEVALICEALGGDIWKVRELVNKSPFRNMHLPGAGVGGHCIPKDPWLLAYGVRDKKNVPLRIIPTARAINDSMPLHMVDLASQMIKDSGRNIGDSKILVMGYAYLEDSDDTRNSPSEILVNRLKQIGADFVIHDPFVSEFQGDMWTKAKGCDAVIVMVAHSEYRTINLSTLKSVLRTPILVDGRHVFDANQARTTGLLYKGIGQ